MPILIGLKKRLSLDTRCGMKLSTTAKMSDYEDEMDVDAPRTKESVLFNSDHTNGKGKRSAANLPVEAEDSLPW